MLKRTVGLVAMILLVCIPCVPQFGVRSVTGIVVDRRGNTLRGAAVQLENTVTLSVISYITARDGQYHFSRLNSDIDYTLKANYRNHWSHQKTLSKFSSSKHFEVVLVVPID
jgi:hypothetical protein